MAAPALKRTQMVRNSDGSPRNAVLQLPISRGSCDKNYRRCEACEVCALPSLFTRRALALRASSARVAAPVAVDAQEARAVRLAEVGGELAGGPIGAIQQPPLQWPRATPETPAQFCATPYHRRPHVRRNHANFLHARTSRVPFRPPPAPPLNFPLHTSCRTGWARRAHQSRRARQSRALRRARPPTADPSRRSAARSGGARRARPTRTCRR